MKTIEQIIRNYKSEAIDGRDVGRLVQFLTEAQLDQMGIKLKAEYIGKHTPIDYTRENILKQLKADVDFGFEKALNRRGLSADAMAACVKMWNWILEEGLENFTRYPMYGLPIFKATALKYGFENPIGDKTGEECEFND